MPSLLTVASLALVFGARAWAQAPAPVASPAPTYEYVLLIDTSSSMEQNRLVAPLRVAMANFMDQLPRDGSSRLWIFTFDRGLGRHAKIVTLAEVKDLEDAKIFVMGLAFKGSATHIYQAVNGVLDQLERALADGMPHEVTFHLFTDGDNTGSGNFKGNVDRLAALRARPGVNLDFYYYGLGVVKPKPDAARLIQANDWLYFVDGITMPPKALFLSSLATATDTTPVTFVNKTIGAAENWIWQFGDDAGSAEESPTHIFKEPGIYDVRLTATNTAGSSTAVRRIVITGSPPRAMFDIAEAENPKQVGQPVRFLDQSTGRVTTRNWDFGDGQGRSQETNPTYTYQQAGTFRVALAVVGPHGQDAASKIVQVAPKPQVDFSFFPNPPKYGQEMKFTNESVGEYGQWQWDFGDGGHSQEASPIHVFAKAGTYTVRLAGTAMDGIPRQMQKTIEVGSDDLPPVAKFTLPTNTIMVGLPVVVNEESRGTITAWHWEFGDGQVADRRQPTPVYTTAGTYAITLTVTGPLGTDQATGTLDVVEPSWRLAVPTPLLQGREATFSIDYAPFHVTSVDWNFGDQTDTHTTSGILARHTYQETGEYTVVATLSLQQGTDSIVLKRQLSATVAVAAETVEVRFDAQAERGVKLERPNGQPMLRGPAPLNVSFVDQSTGPIASRKWDFGDGDSSDAPAPRHEFRTPGRYVVRLALTDQLQRQHATTDSTNLAVEVTGWRPPATWRRPTFILFPLAMVLLWRFLPFQYRWVFYELGDEKKNKKTRCWTKNIALGGASSSATLKLCRNPWLRKRYRTALRGDARWTNSRGESPASRKHLAAKDILWIDGVPHTVRRLNDAATTGLCALAIIAALTALLLWTTWELFV